MSVRTYTKDAHSFDLSEQFRTLLRQLLRQIRILPDASSRLYLRSYAIGRFRHGRDADVLRSHTRLRRVKRELAQLERANEGYYDPLLKVLMMTYGRRGRRRRQLLDRLMKDSDKVSSEMEAKPRDEKARGEASENEAMTNPLVKGLPSLRPENLDRIPVLSGALQSLLRSQGKVFRKYGRRNDCVQNIEPSVPALNSWRRPMPQNRQINQAKAHRKLLLEKVYPPLENKEWEQLKRLTTGEGLDLESEIASTISRAYKGWSAENESSSRIFDFLKGEKSMQQDLLTEKRQRSGGTQKPHTISSRFMRRLYARVFEISPKMEWVPDQKKWKVSWGIEALSSNKRSLNRKLSSIAKSLSE